MRVIKRRLVKIAKKYPATRRLRHWYVVQRNKVLRFFYGFHPVDDKLIIFEVFNGRSYADSPRAIYEVMLEDERFADHKFVWVFKKPGNYRFLENNPRTELVRYRTPRYYKTYASAKYWIVNAMVPLQVGKRLGQVMVQCWHGTPLKRLRNDIIENTRNAMNTLDDFRRKNNLDTIRYDYFVSPSRFATKKFTTAFALKELGKEDILLETGYPRNDYLHTFTDSDTKRIKDDLGIPDDKRVLLYAPTWRDDQHEDELGYVYQPPIDFGYLRQQIGKEWVILFRTHYLISNQFDFSAFEGFVYNVSQIDDIKELYIVSDAIMTDYSSVLFDYANLNRPMIFYMYDREHYEEQLRGFYLDISELPGAIITTEQELMPILRDLPAYQQRHTAKYKEFAEKFVYLDDGRSAKRVIERLFSHEGMNA